MRHLISDLQNIVSSAKADELYWSDHYRFGYYPIADNPVTVYNEEYFDKYVGYAATDIGQGINSYRSSLVRHYKPKEVIDVGIGSGSFIESCEFEVKGYDINHKSVAWLRQKNIFVDPYVVDEIDSLTFWDSLEHIKEFWHLLLKVKGYVFISVPFFSDKNDVLKSKHFRTDEHYWYFTINGMLDLMSAMSFEPLYVGYEETTRYKRDNIGTLVFRKLEC